MLRAITLWEPWATIMAIGAKTNETRGRRTSLRGEIAIHAALSRQGCSDEVESAAFDAFKKRGIQPALSFGCIVAIVEVIDCVPSEAFSQVGDSLPKIETLRRFGLSGGFVLNEEESMFGNYSPDRWIYRTRNLRPLKTPVFARGSQAFPWTVPADIEAQVRRQI